MSRGASTYFLNLTASKLRHARRHSNNSIRRTIVTWVVYRHIFFDNAARSLRDVGFLGALLDQQVRRWSLGFGASKIQQGTATLKHSRYCMLYIYIYIYSTVAKLMTGLSLKPVLSFPSPHTPVA